MGLKLGITMLIHNKDDIQFVTEFLCFLGHPVFKLKNWKGRFTLPDAATFSAVKGRMIHID